MRIIRGFTILVVIMSIFVSGMANVNAYVELWDITGTDCESAVEHLVDLGIISGYPDASFRPAEKITRAAFAKIICISLGYDLKEATAQSNTFWDVHSTHWAVKYIFLANKYGLIKGYGGSFRPEDNISYAEIITILLRALQYGPLIESTGKWPDNYLDKAKELNLTAVKWKSHSDDATRGDVAILTWEALNMKPYQSDVSLLNTTFSRHSDNKIQEIYASGDFSIVLMEDGTLIGWGDNSDGQLGDGSTINREEPYIIMKDVRQAATGGTNDLRIGYKHLLIVKNDNTLWACGDNTLGEIGDGTNIRRLTPVKIMEDVKKAAASCFTSVVLKNDGSVWGWGDNSAGQFGSDTVRYSNVPMKIMEDAKDIGAGTGQTFVIKTDNTLWGVGSNYSNELGLSGEVGAQAKFLKPVRIMDNVKHIIPGDTYSLAITMDGSLWGWGSNRAYQMGTAVKIDGSAKTKIMDDVKIVAAGATHTLIVKNNGDLYTCGSNTKGQLGDGTRENHITPVKVATNIKMVAAGNEHSIIVNWRDEIFAFGVNTCGQLGSIEYFEDVPAKVLSDVTQVTGENHILALKRDGTLWGWGNNQYGQLGDNTKINKSVPVKIASGVKSVSSGLCSTFFIKEDSTLWACGLNSEGQLGDGSTTNRLVPALIMKDVKAVDANYGSTFILKMDGTLWACGDNSFSLLLDGTHVDKQKPMKIMSDVAQISVGDSGVMVIKTDGTLWGWGSVFHYERGFDGYNHAVAVKLMDNVTYVSCSWDRCLILKDGTLYLRSIYYLNNHDISDQKEFEDALVKVADHVKTAATGWYQFIRVDENGALWEYKVNISNEPLRMLEGVSSVMCRMHTNLAIKKDGTLWVWGNNSYGQMSNGITAFSTTPIHVKFEF